MNLYELNRTRVIWYGLRPVITVIAGLIVVYYFYGHGIKWKAISDDNKLYGSIVIFIALSLILYFDYRVFINYLRLSKNIVVEINNDLRMISIQKNELRKNISFENINSVDRYNCRSAHSSHLFYYVIELKDKNEIVITSFMSKTDMVDINIPNQLILVSPHWLIKKDSRLIYNVNSALY